MLELVLTQCKYDSGCHLVDTFLCVSGSRTENFKSYETYVIFEIALMFACRKRNCNSIFKVVDKSLSSSLCSILTQRLIWYPHKLKKASMIIICCTKTPLYLSPYLCYGWKNFFQCCRHLSFCHRSLISSTHHFQFLSCSFGEIYDLISAAMIWSRVPETTL